MPRAAESDVKCRMPKVTGKDHTQDSIRSSRCPVQENGTSLNLPEKVPSCVKCSVSANPLSLSFLIGEMGLTVLSVTGLLGGLCDLYNKHFPTGDTCCALNKGLSFYFPLYNKDC